MSDRVAVMSNGVIEQLDEPRAIYDRPLTAVRGRLHRRHELPRRGGRPRRPTAASPWTPARASSCAGAARRARGSGCAVGIRPERMVAVGRAPPERRPPNSARRPRSLTKMYLGDQIQIVAALADGIERGGARAARRAPTRRWTPSIRATGSPSAGTRPHPAAHERGARPPAGAEGGAMTDQPDDQLNILAPRETKPKLDYLHREVQRAGGRRHHAARSRSASAAWRCSRRLRRGLRRPRRPAAARSASRAGRREHPGRQAAGEPARDLQLVAVRRPRRPTRSSRTCRPRRRPG